MTCSLKTIADVSQTHRGLAIAGHAGKLCAAASSVRSIAPPEARQDLVADGAGAAPTSSIVEVVADQRRRRSPRRTAPAGTSVTSTDDEIHRDAADERAAATPRRRLARDAPRCLGVGALAARG